MLRIFAALLCVVSSWQPAAAGAFVQAAAQRGAPAANIPLLSVAAPVSGLPGGLQPALGLSLTGDLKISAPAPMVASPGSDATVTAGLPIAVAPPEALAGGRAAASLPAARTVLVSVAKAAAEINEEAAPRSGQGTDTSAVQRLQRLFDGAAPARKKGVALDVAVPSWSAWPAQLLAPAKARTRATVQPRSPASVAAEAAKRKSARLALIGTSIYKFGMESLGISMPLIALTVFGSALWMATMAVGWGTCMTLASVLAGGVMDRQPAHKIMAVSLAAQAVLVGGIIAMLVLGVTNPWLVLPLYSLAGITQGIVLTARNCIPARIWGRDHAALSRFNAKTHMIYETAGTIAPLLVGLLISKAGLISGLFVLPPAFLLAALVFSCLKLKTAAARHGAGAAPALGLKDFAKRTLSDIKEGARIVLGAKEFRWLGLMIVGPMLLHRIVEQMLAPIFAKSVLNAPALSAWIVSGSNLGEFLGAVLLLRTLMDSSKGKPSPFRWLRPMALLTLGVWAFASGAGLWLVLPMVLAAGLTFAANDVSLNSYFQSRLPNESVGKAVGFLTAANLGAVMAASYLLGFLFDWLPVGGGLIAVSAAFSLLAALFYIGYAKLRATFKR